jgi:PAS domain S-box-containing protein
MKRAQDGLRESELNLRRLTETIPQNLFGAGADGMVNYINRQMREWFGRADETIMAEEWVHLVHPADRDATVKAWMSAVAAGTPYRHQVRFLHHSGEYRWCIGQAQPLRSRSGVISAWHGVVNDIHDRKLAEDALKASERNLRLTIDTIPALAWSARADGTADFFNRHYLDYVGLSLDELSGWQWMRAIHPDDLAAISSTWETFSANGTGGEIEARVRRHDGTYRWFSFRTHPLRDEQGNVVKWYGVKVDVDDQKRATMMLAGERQLLELIAAGRPLLEVLGTLCDMVETALSGYHCEVRTIDVNDTIFEHIVTPSLPPSFTTGLAGTRLSPDASPCDLAVAQRTQVVVLDINHDPRWAGALAWQRVTDHGLTSAWIAPVSSREGRVLGSVSLYHRLPMEPQPFHQDIIDRATQIASIAIERWRAEDELRRREYLLQTAETISETGWFNWDLNNNKLVWSSQMNRIWEIDDSADPLSEDLLSRVHPDDRQGVEERVTRIFNGEDIPETEVRYFMPDGRMKYIRGSTLIFHYEDGRRECIGVAQDITRHRMAEDALDKVRSELAHVTRVTSLGELTASIAHEVNQPLAGIITNANTCLRMLTADAPDIEGAIRTAQRTRRDGERASQVIQRLRGLFRKQDFAPEPLNLNEAGQEVIAIFSHDLQRRHISLTATFDPALPPVIGDRIQLQQVILNLLLNAADALGSTDAQPRQIFVETAEAAPGVAQFAVRDTGIGIAPDDLGRIFDAFFTTKQDGMGIGLSVSKSIVDRHGGKLWATANDGPGATFVLAIPCAPARDGPPQTSSRPSGEQGR